MSESKRGAAEIAKDGYGHGRAFDPPGSLRSFEGVRHSVRSLQTPVAWSTTPRLSAFLGTLRGLVFRGDPLRMRRPCGFQRLHFTVRVSPNRMSSHEAPMTMSKQPRPGSLVFELTEPTEVFIDVRDPVLVQFV